MAADGPIDVQCLSRDLHELLILATLKPRPLHGYALAQALEQRSRGRVTVSHGTLYPTLHRLERSNYIHSRWTEEGERRRRVYALTHAGASRLRHDSGTVRQVFDVLLELVQPRP